MGHTQIFKRQQDNSALLVKTYESEDEEVVLPSVEESIKEKEMQLIHIYEEIQKLKNTLK